MDKGMSVDKFQVGQTYESTTKITEEMIDHFARATGDFNPLHLDPGFAEKSIFKQRVAHGMLTAGIISGVFGTRFPGLGTIYVTQEMRFLRPVFIGDEITVRFRILEVMIDRNRLRVETTCLNQEGKEVLTGTAVVMPPS